MDIDKLRQIINSKYNAEVIKDGLINSLAFDDDFIDSVLRLRSSKNPKDFVWTENNVIDFVNWHMEVKFPQNSFRYHLENQTLIDSFKRGDKASDWVDKSIGLVNKSLQVGTHYYVSFKMMKPEKMKYLGGYSSGNIAILSFEQNQINSHGVISLPDYNIGIGNTPDEAFANFGKLKVNL